MILKINEEYINSNSISRMSVVYKYHCLYKFNIVMIDGKQILASFEEELKAQAKQREVLKYWNKHMQIIEIC